MRFNQNLRDYRTHTHLVGYCVRGDEQHTPVVVPALFAATLAGCYAAATLAPACGHFSCCCCCCTVHCQRHRVEPVADMWNLADSRGLLPLSLSPSLFNSARALFCYCTGHLNSLTGACFGCLLVGGSLGQVGNCIPTRISEFHRWWGTRDMLTSRSKRVICDCVTKIISSTTFLFVGVRRFKFWIKKKNFYLVFF